MSVAATTSQAPNFFTQQSGESKLTDRNTMGKDDFLRLLVTQLQNQDPMNPASNEEFASQLAQFSTLEKQEEANSIMQESLEATKHLNQSMNNNVATSYIGKDVRAAGNKIHLVEGQEITISFYQQYASAGTKLRVYDSGGGLVKTLELGARPSGGIDIEWDGKGEGGEQLPVGTYTFEPSAVDYMGEQIPTVSFMYGSVTGMRNLNGASSLLIGKDEVPLSDIFDVVERKSGN